MRWWILALALVACKSETPDDTDAVDTDAVDTDPVDTDVVDTDPVDTDVVDTDPVDTDVVDTDVDTDTEPGPQWHGLFGTVTFQRTRGGVLECDFDVDIQAFTPYTGNCGDCDFAFNVRSGIVREDSSAACILDEGDYIRALVDSEENGVYDRWISYTEEVVYEDMYYGEPRLETWSKMLIAGYQYGNADPITGTHTQEGYYGDWTYPAPEQGEGVATFEGSLLNFRWEDSFTEWGYDVYDPWCYDTVAVELDRAMTDGDWIEGTLPCDVDRLDAYRFEAPAGAEIAVAVDTTAADAFSDLTVRLLDPDMCSLGYQDDSFRCSVQPTDSAQRTTCPAMEATLTAGGTYTLAVDVYGSSCASSAEFAAYRLYVRGATPGSLVLQRDEYDSNASSTVSTVISGALELVPAN